MQTFCAEFWEIGWNITHFAYVGESSGLAFMRENCMQNGFSFGMPSGGATGSSSFGPGGIGSSVHYPPTTNNSSGSQFLASSGLYKM